MNWLISQKQKIYDYAKRDIGCSGGFFLSKFSADKWEREGVLTQEFYWNGKYHDRVMLSLIRDDFVNNK